MTDDLIRRAEAAMEGVTPGRPVQFHPRFCDQAKGAKYIEWDTSHDLSVIREDGSRYFIAHFRHANDALFDQLARSLVPELTAALKERDARIAELEAENARLRAQHAALEAWLRGEPSTPPVASPALKDTP